MPHPRVMPISGHEYPEMMSAVAAHHQTDFTGYLAALIAAFVAMARSRFHFIISSLDIDYGCRFGRLNRRRQQFRRPLHRGAYASVSGSTVKRPFSLQECLSIEYLPTVGLDLLRMRRSVYRCVPPNWAGTQSPFGER
ncbi:MAG: hypothetical protein QOG17_2297 [Gammaproteobacteria bacterium]|nr:hypothetical protein [Gammaproteobacteria bacterium]